MQYRFNTPQRSRLNRVNNQNQPSGPQYYQSHQSNRYDSIIDYKAKAFELMQTVTELEIKDKQSHRTIFYLQRELEIIHKNLQQFLEDIGFSSLSQVKSKYLQLEQKIAQMNKQNQKPLIKEEKITVEYEKILGEYKKMIKIQQDKMVKYQNKWKLKEASLTEQHENSLKQQQILRDELQQSQSKQVQRQKRNQTEKKTIIQKHQLQLSKLQSEISQLKSQLNLKKKQEDSKIKENSKKLFDQNIEMKQDLEMLKSQFRELLIQKQSTDEKHEKLKKKYKHEIQHFQMIEREVEEKLIEVEKEITFYKEERQTNLQLVQKLQYENQILKQNPHQIQDQFSFGGYFNAQTQTQSNEQPPEISMNVECYEISIKSLLEENSRLKKTLVLLDKTKRGEQIPAEAQLELKLLRGLTEMPSSKSRRAEKESQDSPTFKVLENQEKQQNDF